MRLQVVAVCLYAFLTALLWPYSSRADTPPPPPPQNNVNDEALVQAKQHFEAGRNAYNAGDYVTAIREFKAAEALRPSAILAYNIGLGNEKLGKKKVALKYYKRYLEQLPAAQNRAEVEGRIAQLEQDLSGQAPPPPPQPGDQQPPPPPTAEQPGDMPPPTAGQPTSGYDPYASSAPPIGTQQPVKRKSYWWVWLIVAGGGLLLIGVIVAVAVVYGNTYSTVYGADRAMLSSPRDPGTSSGRGTSTYPLFHF